MCWPPRASIERTDRILIYVPSKPSSRPSTGGWLCPHYFIGWIGRETGYGPTDRSAVVLWIVSGALFLKSSGPAQPCWRLHERLLYVDRVRYVCLRIIRGLSVKSVLRVGQKISCMVYIDLNRRDSRIWVSLICDSRHIDNFMNLMSLM
jgi:hypothetical protein